MKFFYLLVILCVAQTVTAQQPVLFTGRTTGRLPFLDYGLGEDRLGGAKLGYLDSNIAIRVSDSTRNVYKVALSKDHSAWLPKSSLRKDTSVRIAGTFLTSSWRIWGDDKYDYVSVGLTERLPYRTVMELSPSRIIVDIFGAVSNTNWITQLKTVKEIRNAWYEQIEDDVFRVIIELKHKQHWGYSVYYN